MSAGDGVEKTVKHLFVDGALSGIPCDEVSRCRDRDTVRCPVRSSIPVRPAVNHVAPLLWVVVTMVMITTSGAAEMRRVKEGVDHLTAYRGPSTRYDDAARLPSGAWVDEIRRVDGWSQILTSDGRVGYVNTDDLVAADTVSNPQERVQADGPEVGIVPQVGHPGQVTDVAFSPDGRMIATGQGNAIQTRSGLRLSGSARLWDVEAGRLQRVLGKRSSDVRAVAVSPDGSTIATGYGSTIPAATGLLSSGGVQIWDSHTGGRERELGGLWDSVTSIAFSADGRMVAAGLTNSTARVWDLAGGREPTVLGDHADGVTAVAFSPDGRVLATASGAWDNTVRLWEISSGRELAVIEGHSEGIDSIAFSPDGRVLATASRDDTARLWDAASGRELTVLEEHTTSVVGVAFSRDGRLLATTSWDNTARLWDVATGRQLQVLEGHLANVNGAAFSPDGRTVATASDTVRLWDVATGRQLTVMEGQSGIIEGIAFGADGRTVVTTSRDNTAHEWDADTGRKLVTLIKLVDGSWLQLTPAGFFDASEDGTRNLALVRGLDPVPFERVSHALHRPDLVAEAMAGDPEGRYAAAATALDLEEAVASHPLPQ